MSATESATAELAFRYIRGGVLVLKISLSVEAISLVAIMALRAMPASGLIDVITVLVYIVAALAWVAIAWGLAYFAIGHYRRRFRRRSGTFRRHP